MGRLRIWTFAAVLLLACAVSQAADRPKLVVLISIDQFRADYLTRFEDLYLPAKMGAKVGGFRYLMERGAYFPNAHHDHLPLATGPGHSIHFTGAPPYKSGIVGNDWWDYSPGVNRSVYCVEDDDSPLVGTDAKAHGISPSHLRVTTVGDELKMATGGHARVFGIALKDRAAVLMAGHLADGVFWFDDSSGSWITSRYYRKDGTLPAWVQELNARRIPQSYFDKTWTLSVPEPALRRLWTPDNRFVDGRAIGQHFPHPISAGQTTANSTYLKAFVLTPFANQYVLDSAETLIKAERLGQESTPDILAVNLASNDYLGHSYGPDSAEVLDMSVQTDRQISGLLNYLNSTVPGGLANVVFVVTADHGASPIPAEMRASGINAGIWKESAPVEAAQAAMEKEFGPGKWALAYIEPYLWLNRQLLEEHRIPREQAEEIAAAAVAKVDGIYAAYAGHRILEGGLPATDIAARAYRSYHPLVSGDVLVISQPFHLARGTELGTSHGEPYTYDTRVPLLLAGFGIRPGTYTERVSTLDTAPTLSFLLHVNQPSGCEGHILSPALLADGPSRRTER